jgi:hypothetical protein
MTPSNPKRPSQHITGDNASRIFDYRSSPKWSITDSTSDYGWDKLVYICHDNEIGQAFFVQCKGTGSPIYIENGSYISKSINTSTYNWLMSQNAPIMICICDETQGEKLYWVWLQEIEDELKLLNAKGEKKNNHD